MNVVNGEYAILRIATMYVIEFPNTRTFLCDPAVHCFVHYADKLSQIIA